MSVCKPYPPAEHFTDLVSYEPDTGLFRWVRKPNIKIRVGDIAGRVNSWGYVRLFLNRRAYQAHRVAWLLFHNRLPAREIDHINGVRSDNRISNLREATSSEQKQNTGLRRSNKSGHVGVHMGRRGRYVAAIRVNGRTYHLGTFDRAEDAGNAYKAAKRKYHQFQPVIRGDA